LGRYDTVFIIAAAAITGMLLPDVIDMVRQNDRDKIKSLLKENKEFGTDFLKKQWYVLLLLAAVLYFFTKKDITDKKQYFLLVILLLVFVFLLSNTIKLSKNLKLAESNKETAAPFSNLLDAELALAGGFAGLFIAQQQTDDTTWRYALYGILGIGVGLLAGKLLRKALKIDTLLADKDQEMQNRKTNSKILLVSIGKAVAGKDGEAVIGENVDDFLANLNSREIMALDRIYENQQPKMDKYGKEIYNEIITDLKRQGFDEKDTATFAQAVNSLSLFLTGKYLKVNDQGKAQDYLVKNTIEEYAMDKDNFLVKTAQKHYEGDTVRGSERWLWVTAKINDRVIKRQIRLIDIGANRYILYVGVETA